jgi:uncharacterized membrane protein (DUF485 family)
MSSQAYDRVVAHPKYKELLAKRNGFAGLLSVIVLVVFYGYVLTAALSPDTFASPAFTGTQWCVGLVGGFLIQAFAFVMTGIYVHRANGEFDDINRALIEETNQ